MKKTLLILTALFPKLIMPYSESMEFVGEEINRSIGKIHTLRGCGL